MLSEKMEWRVILEKTSVPIADAGARSDVDPGQRLTAVLG